MSKKILSYTFLIVIIFSSLAMGQRKHKQGWRTWEDWDDFDDIAWIDFNPNAAPMIEFTYGFPVFKQKNFNGDFSKIGSMELKLGYSDTYQHWEDFLIEREDNFIFGSYNSADLISDEPLANEFDFNIWQFGLAKREGYGYDLDPLQIIPYTQSALVWSRLKLNQTPGEPVTQDSLLIKSYLSDMNTLNRYDGAFRFGMDYETGMRINIASFMDISGGYQFGTIYPRYLVWKQLGSFGIETLGLALLDGFVKEIMDSSPAAGPLMNALLKGAYSYGFYLLRKDKMNWPFDTEKPLTYETFKIGLTFTF